MVSKFFFDLQRFVENSNEDQNIIYGSSDDDVMVFYDGAYLDSGDGDDSIEGYGGTGTIKTGTGKDTITFHSYDGGAHNSTNVTLVGFDKDNDILHFPGWAFYSSVYLFRASINNGNLTLRDGTNFYAITFEGINNTSDIKNAVVNAWGYRRSLGSILYNTVDGGEVESGENSEGNSSSGNDENNSTGVNGNENVTNLETFTYSQLTESQKKDVRENSLESLKSLISVADDVNVELSADDFDDKNIFDKAKNWTKFAKFVAKLYKQYHSNTKIDKIFSIVDNANTIAKNVKDICDGKKPMNDLKATNAIIDSASNIFYALDDFSGILNIKNEVLDLSLIASLTGLAVNVVALVDESKVTDKKRQDIEKSFIDLSGRILKYTLDTYGLADKVIKGTSGSLTSPFGPVNAGIAALTGVVTGFDQFFSSNTKYKKDGLDTATQNAWIDAFSTGIYEAAHKYTFGADNAIFEGTRFLAYALMGKADQYTESDLNYMEWIGTAAKISLLGEVHGNDTDNGIETVAEKTEVVAGGGNDFIIKNHSQVTIYGGTGYDTLGGFQLEGTEKNYIDMGDGNDSVTIYDKKSTIYGGKGDDIIKVMGVQSNAVNVYVTDNQIYGDDGNDVIYLNKAVSNIVRGGSGNDTIGLENSRKTYIEYREGDGTDSIVGYGETDTIRLTRVLSSYSTVESGNDVIIYVGNNNEGIILVDAKGKKINLSADNTPKKEDMDVFEIKQGMINGANLRVSAGYEGDIWAGDDDNLKNLKVIDAKSNSHGGILAGNSISNSIVGGNGRNSLWGGASGNNTLTGGTARDQFWYGGNGKDIVTNFSAGNGANNDVVVLFGGELSGVNRSGSNVALNMSNGNSINLKTNSSSAEEVIQYSTDGNNIFGAKIGASNTKSLNYDSSVNYFQLNGGGTLNVSNSGENNVWLDGSQGQAFSGINNINATGNGKNILAGNGENNSIVSGSGTSSLWGGSGNSADTLVGGSGAEMFWYGKNDGADLIQNASSGDIVNLYDVSLADITAATASGNKISVTCNTGNNLQINSAENLSPTFQLADSSRWQFNHSSGNWQSA